MKRVTINMVWENSVTVDVPDDFDLPARLNDIPGEVKDQMTPDNVDLVDWSLS